MEGSSTSDPSGNGVHGEAAADVERLSEVRHEQESAELREKELEKQLEEVRREKELAEARKNELVEARERELREAREHELEEARERTRRAQERQQELEARQAELQEGKHRLELARLVQARSYTFGGFLLAIFLAVLALLSMLLGDDLDLIYRTRLIAAICLSVGAFAAVSGSLLVPTYLSARKVEREEEERARRAAAEAAEELADAEDLAALIKANRKQMEAYDVLARGQAKTAFRNSQVAMGAGLVVLFVGAIIAIATNDTASKITTASLTAIGGMLSGYIARTFLQTYFRAIRQLNFYFQQPLINSYLLSAQRLIRAMSSKEKRDPALSEVITRMMDVLIRLPWSGGELDSDRPRNGQAERASQATPAAG